MKKILLLGGTQFIGRNLVEKLLEIGEFEITLFNRQRTQPDLFPQTHKIKGDRETEDIRQIANGDWDYVIDLSCYYPEALQSALNCLDTIDKYIFVSTCSVYDNKNNPSPLRNETAQTLGCSSLQKNDRNPETYGNRKAECERILADSGLPYIILRPALVFGKYDPTDRLYYWLHQVKTRDTLLLPENGERLFSITYVMDLVEALVQSILQSTSNDVFNVISNPKTSIRQIVGLAQEFLKSDFSTVNASAEFLKENGVSQWTDMPLWINGDHFTYDPSHLQNQLGIQPTDFKQAINESLKYYENLNWPQPKYGMSNDELDQLRTKIQVNKF